MLQRDLQEAESRALGQHAEWHEQQELARKQREWEQQHQLQEQRQRQEQQRLQQMQQRDQQQRHDESLSQHAAAAMHAAEELQQVVQQRTYNREQLHYEEGVVRESREKSSSQAHYDEAYLQEIWRAEKIIVDQEEQANVHWEELRARRMAVEEAGAEAKQRMAESRLESRRQHLYLERARLRSMEEDVELEIREVDLTTELRAPPPPPPPPPRRRSRSPCPPTSRPPAHLLQQQHQQWQQWGWESTWEEENTWGDETWVEPTPKRRHGPRGGRSNPNVAWFTMLSRARADGWEAEFRATHPKPERGP